MKRGEIWWADLPPPAGRRPVALVSRDEAYTVRQLVIVARVTRRSRGIPTELQVSGEEGLPHPSVINCDVLETINKRLLMSRVGELGSTRLAELDRALRFALGLE